jgi:undecaprenyl-diphosphatase
MNIFDTLKGFDTQLFLFFNGHHNEFFDSVMLFSSGKWSWTPLYILLLIFIVNKLGWKALPAILIGLAALITISDQASVHLFKNVFLRYRPCHNIEIQHLVHLVKGCGGQYGFVSSHASNSFALATFVGLLLFDKLKFVLPMLWIWALWVGYSRIYNGVHYPGDVLGGSVLGLLVGFIVFKAFNFYNIRSKTIKE